MEKKVPTERQNTMKRNIKVVGMWYDLYEVQRIRPDDVIKAIEKEFFISTVTVKRVLWQNKRHI